MSVTDKKHPRMVMMSDDLWERIGVRAKMLGISRAEYVRRSSEVSLRAVAGRPGICTCIIDGDCELHGGNE